MTNNIKRGNKMTLNSESNVHDTIFHGVKTMLKRRSTPWVGTVSQLSQALQKRFGQTKNWPGSASAFRVALNKVLARLRNAGVSIKFTRATDRTRTRLVKFSIN